MVLHVSWLSKRVIICVVLCRVKHLNYRVNHCCPEQLDVVVRVLSLGKGKTSFHHQNIACLLPLMTKKKYSFVSSALYKGFES